jgi:hypothetical protein
LKAFLIRAKIPTEAVNKMVQDPNFLKNFEEYMKKVKPEAAYFMPSNGDRLAAFIVNMQSHTPKPIGSIMYGLPAEKPERLERIDLNKLVYYEKYDNN